MKRKNIPLKTYSIPISVKAILFDNNKVWLRKNERNEWELPGGKIDIGEQPEQTVIREIKEELGLKINVINIIQSHVYTVDKSQDESNGVLVLSYLCKIVDNNQKLEIIGEAGRARFQTFSINKITHLNMPNFYKNAINKAYKLKLS